MNPCYLFVCIYVYVCKMAVRRTKMLVLARDVQVVYLLDLSHCWMCCIANWLHKRPDWGSQLSLWPMG